MEVYARYITENNLEFRIDTVLRFGDSWEIIGAAVLVNPGSAEPMSAEIGVDTLSHLTALTGGRDSWRQFSPDPTMGHLAKIFSGWYAGEGKPLEGCILLLNLFNMRDKTLTQALELQKTCKSRHLFSTETDIRRLTRIERVYLGWGDTGKNQLRQYALPIFEAVKDRCPYLNPVFDLNPFYHPRFVNLSYTHNPATQKLIKTFKA